MKIDQHYYRANPVIYGTDFTVSLGGFLITFVLLVQAAGWLTWLYLLISSAFLYRAGAFIHELTHQHRSGQLRWLHRLWNLTVGAIVMTPAVRFFHPHLTHHRIGIFATRDDPQYMLIRTDWKLAVTMLLVLPPLMPLASVLTTLFAALGNRLDLEGVIERYLERKKDASVGTALPDHYKREVTAYSRYYLMVAAVYLWLWPETLPLMYAVQVLSWWLVILRIPLEHEMREYRDSTDAHDHVVDSFTVESPFAELLQPLCLRLHTAHHMYPGVPYHNLPALHAELKRTDPQYRKSVVSFWTLVRGPRRTEPGREEAASEAVRSAP